MLRSIKDITKNYELLATDGQIGKVNDFYFDDIFWKIKYLVADTGSWLHERLVLISPVSLGQPDWALGKLPVNLTKEKIENSPSVFKDQPVSKQQESKLLQYYTWPVAYGHGMEMANFADMQLYAKRIQQIEQEKNKSESLDESDPHLRSFNEVKGYHIDANDGEIGHIEDFVVEDKTWIIRYMIVDTRNWLPGRQVLVSPEWITKFDWAKSEVSVDLSQNIIKNSPEFDPKDAVNRDYEAQLYDYYGRPVYWDR